MDGGHLQASLLSAGVDQLTVLPADTVMVLPSRASELPGTASAVFTRLAEHTGAQLVDAVQYIDLSKAHLTTAHHNMEVSVVSDGHEAAGRVFLHGEYPRWQAVKQRLQLLEDHEVARVLLDLYESTVESEQLAMKADVDQDEYGGDENTRVVHCEISGSARPPPPRIVDVRGAAGEMGTSCAVARSGQPATHSAPVAVRARRTARASIPRRDRPCPRSKKPPGWHQQEPEPVTEMDADITYESCSDGGGHEEEVLDLASGAELTPSAEPAKLFTFPPVEPELLCYFSCGLCDERGFNDVERYFDHLWRQHTEFHMVGGRIQRVPIRLRPQLFVICAFCGLNNKGSNGYVNGLMYLTRQHMPSHSPLLTPGGEPLRCDECLVEFDDRGSLALHSLDTEHDNPAHRCTACGLDMEGDANYIAHLRAHYLSHPYQCYFCMQLFVSEADCIGHIKRHHSGDYNVHKCSGCGYVTALFHDFLLHIRSHSHLNRHVCHVCGVMFVSKMSLKHHIRTHSDSKFPCDKCDKVFSHPQTRRRHELNAHHRPDKCTCGVCGRQFGSAYSMKRHFMIHTGERPFQCDKCGRGFVQKGDLQSHYKRCKFTDMSHSVFTSI